MKNEDRAWVNYKSQFADVYDEYNYTSALQTYVMHASHKLLEKDFKISDNYENVLEIGAGTGEHLKFVQHKFKNYHVTDNNEEALKLAKRKIDNKISRNVIFEKQVGNNLSYTDNTFDRLIAVHVLEHIYEPHLTIKEWMRVVKDGGIISILVPTDPGLLWRLGRCLGPRKNALRKGIAYDYVMAREHVNSCHNLFAILNHTFGESRDKWWPLNVGWIDCNLFYAFHAIVRK